MFVIIILLFAITSFVDLKATYHNQDKTKLIVYFALMAASCAISIASIYVINMPSPANPIKHFIIKLMGK